MHAMVFERELFSTITRVPYGHHCDELCMRFVNLKMLDLIKQSIKSMLEQGEWLLTKWRACMYAHVLG